MKIKVPMKLKTSFLRTKLKLDKHAPEILLITGIVSVVGSAVGACVATTKAKPVIDEAKKEIDEISKEEILVEETTPKEKKKKMMVVFFRCSGKVIKLYLPAAAAMAFGIACFVCSNDKLKSRNKELAAQCTALTASLAELKRRIGNTLGEDANDELYYGIKKQEIEVEETDPETGKKKKRKDILSVVEDDPLSPYVIYIKPGPDEGINGLNLMLRYMTQKAFLVAEGRRTADKPTPLFFNELCDWLEIPDEKRPDGQRVGWLFDPENPDIDNVIDLRPKLVKRKNKYGELEDWLMLDPNVDGDVLERWYELEKKSKRGA